MNYEGLLKSTLIKYLKRDSIRCIWYSGLFNKIKGTYIDLEDLTIYYDVLLNEEHNLVCIETCDLATFKIKNSVKIQVE